MVNGYDIYGSKPWYLGSPTTKNPLLFGYWFPIHQLLGACHDRSTWPTRSTRSRGFKHQTGSYGLDIASTKTNKKNMNIGLTCTNAVTSYPIRLLSSAWFKSRAAQQVINRIWMILILAKKSAASPFASSTTIVLKNIAEVDPCVLIWWSMMFSIIFKTSSKKSTHSSPRARGHSPDTAGPTSSVGNSYAQTPWFARTATLRIPWCRTW